IRLLISNPLLMQHPIVQNRLTMLASSPPTCPKIRLTRTLGGEAMSKRRRNTNSRHAARPRLVEIPEVTIHHAATTSHRRKTAVQRSVIHRRAMLHKVALRLTVAWKVTRTPSVVAFARAIASRW